MLGSLLVLKRWVYPLKKFSLHPQYQQYFNRPINIGVYDVRHRTLLQTTSPAMDILISSNVERVLCDKFGTDRTKELMESLKDNRSTP